MKRAGHFVGFVALSMLSVAIPFDVWAGTQTLKFQEGDGGAYSTTHGATVFRNTAIGDGSGPTLWASYEMQNYDVFERLSFLAFPDIIGNNPGQIPPGSTIEAAHLRLTRSAYSFHTATLRLITAPWDENTINGANIANTTSIVTRIPMGNGAKSVDVTATVQLWASGTENYGFEIWPGPPGGFYSEAFYSDDAPVLSNRPLLSVVFTPPRWPAQASTWGKVKALYR